VAERIGRRFDGLFVPRRFELDVPMSAQPGTPARLKRPYLVPVAWTDWMPEAPRPGLPVLVCLGGVANTAARFSFLAADLQRAGQRVVCMDWVGRGRSGWLADERSYQRSLYAAQLRRLVHELGDVPVAILGSSMGGSVAIEFAARHPGLVRRLVLNDVGPEIPAARRRRRAETLARWYVFRTPQEIERRVGAAQKNDGPVPDDVRLFVTWHQTRWSAEDGGRVYRHDPRALLAYRRDAQQPLALWRDWARLRCRTLVLHGLQSDALTLPLLRRMGRPRPAAPPPQVVHVPATGHTPALCDRHQTGLVAAWLQGRLDDLGPCCLLPAATRSAGTIAADSTPQPP
jgi:pimeloyl-ACP methyl ester carboxylesterase